MKNTLTALALASAMSPLAATADAGDIVVRLRATQVSPDVGSSLGSTTNSSYGIPNLAQLVYGSNDAKLKVDSNLIPELDVSYYITRHIAAELIVALGSGHAVSVSGTGGVLNRRELGDVNLLPPTLTFQWHFTPEKTIDPYLGVGVTMVHTLDNTLAADTAVGTLPIHVERSAWGPAFQFGVDVNLTNRWLVNFDVKKSLFSHDVTLDTMGAAGLPAGTTKIDSLDIDPWIISFGIGKKF